MQCEQVKKRLSAWADNQITQDEEKLLAEHLAVCSHCRTMATAYEKLALALDDLGPIRAPRGFSKKVLKASRHHVESVDINQWWQHLSLAWRGMVCTMAMAGLLFGAVLGTSLPTYNDGTDNLDALIYFTIPEDGDYY